MTNSLHARMHRPRTPSVLTSLSVLSLAIVLTGCGGGQPSREIKLTPMTGTVKIDGAPAAGVSVLLTPKGETKGQGSWGVTDSQGMFVLKSSETQGEGIEPGAYSVYFSQLVQEDGTPLPPNTSPYASGIRVKERIPPQWSDRTRENPVNSVTIVEGGKPLEFDIKTK